MTLEEAIAHIENHMQYYVLVDDLPALKIALDALRSQVKAEKNEPLALDELQEMDGELVWVIPKGGYVDLPTGFCVINSSIAEIPGVTRMWYKLSEYGRDWLAYRKKPSKIMEQKASLSGIGG